MSIHKIFLNKYAGILLILEFVNALIFNTENVLSAFHDPGFQYTIGVVATFLAALLIGNYFHDKQEKEKKKEKEKNEKKCREISLIMRKNRIQSSKVLPSEEDFEDDYDGSMSNFQRSVLYFERIQNIVYSNIGFIPPKSLTDILPILSDFPIIHSMMSPNEILNERSNAELCLTKLTEMISKDNNFCDGN